MVMIENYLILGLKRFNCAGSLRGAHARVPACACTRVYSRATRDRGRNAGEGSEAANEGWRGEGGRGGKREIERLARLVVSGGGVCVWGRVGCIDRPAREKSKSAPRLALSVCAR